MATMNMFSTAVAEDPLLDKKIPRELHMTRILKQHPWHPFKPDLDDRHVCYDKNAVFGQCMAAMPEDMELHMKHVNCYEYKATLMQCFVRDRRRQRELQEPPAQ
eukprot:TRINITY_DN51885_c0_g1_i1.p1 TRINITY_DN51885_c0_g1~~TRINITY_DN51885_c0_g1_i1.p1  ORF type:complete len:104 (+),score=43.58 TRINITY_DN51885_c0_g1_i1:131-442(+)